MATLQAFILRLFRGIIVFKLSKQILHNLLKINQFFVVVKFTLSNKPDRGPINRLKNGYLPGLSVALQPLFTVADTLYLVFPG